MSGRAFYLEVLGDGVKILRLVLVNNNNNREVFYTAKSLRFLYVEFAVGF